MAESTVWTQLSSPNSPTGSIPFVDDDNVSIKTDVLNLKYIQSDSTQNLTGSFKPKQLTVDGGLRECMDDLTASVNAGGLYTINKPIGKVVIPAGLAVARITNFYCGPGAFISLQIETSTDATLKNVAVAVGNGNFNINGDAVATANVRVAFMIVNTF